MIKAVLKDEAFLTDLRGVEEGRDRLDIWWLGQSGFLLHWNGKNILLDPYLSDSLTLKYQGTAKPHIRMCERVVDPAKLHFMHYVTSSHVHTDHLDPDTLAPLFAGNAGLKLILPLAHLGEGMKRAGCSGERMAGLDAGQTYAEGEISFTAVPAAHETLKVDEEGHHLFLGYIVRAGPWTLYHSGDTVLYPGMAELLKPYAVDVSFLPINGTDPSRGVSGNMNAREAVWLAKNIDSKLTIPCHFHLFEFNTVEPDEFIETAKKEQVSIRVMQVGERLSLKL
jgi:L-ascorbate metabolism protein UlaG (beta-lactamase superfamily)